MLMAYCNKIPYPKQFFLHFCIFHFLNFNTIASVQRYTNSVIYKTVFSFVTKIINNVCLSGRISWDVWKRKQAKWHLWKDTFCVVNSLLYIVVRLWRNNQQQNLHTKINDKYPSDLNHVLIVLTCIVFLHDSWSLMGHRWFTTVCSNVMKI